MTQAFQQTNYDNRPKPEHKLFVLRMWREAPTDIWRLAIQPSDAPKAHGLPTIDALLAFMRAEMEQ